MYKRQLIQHQHRKTASNFRQRVKLTAPSTYIHRQFGQNIDSCLYYGEKDGLFHPTTLHPRFIVTGGAGFIGSHLVKGLRQHYSANQIKVLDNLWRGHLGNLQYENGSWAISSSDDFCLVDLRDASEALKFVRGADVVYHLAGVVAGINYSSFHEATMFHDNILINSNTIYASRMNQIGTFIYISVPHDSSKSLDKTGRFSVEFGSSSNDRSKLMGEYELELSQSDDFNTGIARLHHVYGPYSDYTSATGLVVASLIGRALTLTSSSLVVWGSGQQYRDFIYISDVIDALLRMPQQGLNQGIFEIGTSKATPIGNLARAVIEIAATMTDRQLSITFDSSQPEERGGKVATIDRAKHLLGWTPKVNLKEGIAKTMTWIRANRAKQRVLVIAIGQSRGGDLAWKSLHKYLLRPLQAHLAIYVSNWQPRTLLKEMSQYIWTIPNYSTWDIVFDRIAETCSRNNLANKWRSYCQIPGIFMGGIQYCPHPASSAISLAFRWLVQQKIFELNLLNKYDWFILTRADELYLCDHESFYSMNSSHILLPTGEYYGGWSDRHIIGKSDLFVRMLNMTAELVCRPEYWFQKLRSTEDRYNLEKLQKFMWSSLNITVSEFPRSMLVVRAPNDTTRWTQGTDHPGLSLFNLKLKYPQELSASLKHCRTTNLTHTLRLIEQYDWQN